MKKTTKNLTVKMMGALGCGLIVGLIIIFLRETLIKGNQAELWNTINNLLFADISAEGNEKAIGIFYIVGQLFVRALQVVIIPMVFTSIVLAMIHISDTKKLGRISGKTIGYFMLTTICAIVIAALAGRVAYNAGVFTNSAVDLTQATGTAAAPGAGAVILFTILSGVGFNNELTLLTYTLILTISRPIEMLVTSLNVVGDSACAIAVAKSEGVLDEEVYKKL